MATVYTRLTLSTYDAEGGGSTFVVHVAAADTATLAQVVTALAALKTSYLTMGVNGIKQAEFSLVDKALASDPTGTERAGAGGIVDFNAGTPATTYGLWVPGLDPAVVLPNGTIDITADPTLSFIADYAGPAAVLGGTYTNPAYAALGDGIDAFSTNRKRNKRVRP